MARALSRRVHERLGRGSRSRVELSDYRDYLHVYVTSRKFARMPMLKRGSLIWEWLEEELSPSEQGKVTLLLPLTPAEERRYQIVPRLG